MRPSQIAAVQVFMLICLTGNPGVGEALSGPPVANSADGANEELLAKPSSSSSSERSDLIRIGVLAKRGHDRCLAQWGLTAEYLSNEIPDYRFEVVPLDFNKISPAVERGEVEFVLANPAFYVDLEQRYGASSIATLKNVRLGGVYAVFAGVVFCRADREDIRQLPDLKGKAFMAVEETSLGGWLMAWRELKEQGINPGRHFTSLQFGGTHDAVVLSVLRGDVDAGTVRTDTLERMEREGKIRLDDFRVLRNERVGTDTALPFLHSTRAYPEWPFAKASHTSDELAIGAYVADVSGHGVAASLLSVTISRVLTPQPSMSSLLVQPDDGPTGQRIAEPTEVVTELNKRFPMEASGNKYFTIVYGILNTDTREFRYVSAGHPPIIRLSRHGQAELLKVAGTPIGLFPEADWEEQVLRLETGDRLCIYSDGLTEAFNAEAEQFGEQRLMRTLSGGSSEDLDGLLAAIVPEVEEWCGTEGPGDDVSLLVLEVQ